MLLNLKRVISLLLVLMLLIGIVPSAFAAEVTTDGAEPEETVSEPESIAEETDPTEPTEPTDPPDNGEAAVMSVEELSDADYGIMTVASTQSGIMLFDFSDNGDYTSRLNSQISVTYKPNGTGTAKTAYIKNLGWHFARYNNTPYADEPLYCIEPYRTYAASTSGNSVDRGVTVDGSSSTQGGKVWYALPEARREAIALILLYSDYMWDHSISVTTTSKANNPNVPLRVATQFLIYEIVCGLRNPSTFVRNSKNESGTSGSIFYDAGVAAISGFKSNYDALVSYVQDAMKIPSFTGTTSSNAPTITLTGTTTTVTDTNGVLSNFAFTNGSGAKFTKSGNTLTITQTGSISSSKVFKASRSIRSAANSSFNIWYMSNSTYQTCISLYSPTTSDLYAYFKLDAPATADLDILKDTGDDSNLEGWEFGIYSDAACTSLISGPHTTDANGKITVTELDAGPVYVKELGHSDPAIEALYVCASTNPQQATLTAGETATVSFTNNLRTGYAKIIKVLENPEAGSLEGWSFEVKGSAGTSMGVYTTDAAGAILCELYPGTYTVTEVLEDGSLWECVSGTSQTVTVTAGQTVEVTFTNALRPGEIVVQKVNHEGTFLAGVEFLLEWSEDDGDTWNPVTYTEAAYPEVGCCTTANLVDGKLVTDESGMAVFSGLHPNLRYRLTETRTVEGYQLLTDCAFEGELSIENDLKEELTVVNCPTFKMPETGSKSLALMPVSILLCLGVCAGILIHRRKK